METEDLRFDSCWEDTNFLFSEYVCDTDSIIYHSHISINVSWYERQPQSHSLGQRKVQSQKNFNQCTVSVICLNSVSRNCPVVKVCFDIWLQSTGKLNFSKKKKKKKNGIQKLLGRVLS